MNTAPKSPNIGMVNSIGKAANSTLTSIGKAANSTMTSVGNSLTGAANAAANVASNFGNSIRNLGTPIQNSIETIPVTANTGKNSGILPSFITFPIIIGFSIIVLLVTITYYYQEQISTALQDLSKSIGDMFKSTDTTATTADTITADTAAADTDEEKKDLPAPSEPHASVIDSIVKKRKQVFNISENKYTYADAEPLCKALGAELATYDQVKKSWDAGADWCNYGWVKGQAAVYPTQKSTFDRLQSSSSDDERMACGSVGVNGGFMDNPELRFGVTCYGDKPTQSEHDVQNMMKGPVPPLTPDVLNMRKKELRYKQHSNEIGVLPFKEGSWAE